MIRFKKEKKPGLLGQSTLFTLEQPGTLEPFQIEADQAGIRFKGNSERINDPADLQIFAKAVSDAWTAHTIYRPKITSITGH